MARLNRTRLAAAVLAGAAVVLMWWTLGARTAPAPPSRLSGAPVVVAPVEQPPPPTSSAASPTLAAAAALAPTPGSLRDTDVDGALVADANGRLLVNPDVRRFFDYFFVASGETSARAIAVRVSEAINARLQAEAARDAHALFQRFLRYRDRVDALAPTVPDDLDQRYATLRALRVEVFGAADAAALFGDEDAVYAAALAERRIRADRSLSDTEREARLAEIDATLPAEVREARRDALAPANLARDEAALRAAGGSPAEIQALREQAVGAEAAERLAALDQQRAAWQARVDEYRRERAAIDADTNLDAAQRQAAISALRSRHFQGPELVRIEALDQIAAEGR